MKRLKQVLTMLILAAVAPVALAQHSGHGGASSGGGFGSAGADSSLRTFKRALLLQATDEQRVAFATCLEATERAQEIADQIVGSGTSVLHYDASVFPRQKEQLQAALVEMGAAHRHFRQLLSQAQGKELGKYLGKLDRFDAELGSRMARVDRELSKGKPDPRRLHSDTHKIKEVTEKWRSEHHKIGNEIGLGG